MEIQNRSMSVHCVLAHRYRCVIKWFQSSLPVGERWSRNMDHGTLYFMLAKAVGNDWHKRSVLTLRHAAGGGKYTPSNSVLIARRKRQ